MRKTKKGMTLIEILVAISVFTIIIFALFSTVAAMRNVVSRQEEAVRIKMVCQDINVYRNKFGKTTWYGEYFGGDNGDNTSYLTSDYIPTDNKPHDNYYVITFEDDIIKIVSSDGRTLVENLKLPLKQEVENE